MKHLFGAGLFAGGLVGGLVVGWLVKYPPVDSPSAASWVQAVASVGAIVWAGYSARKSLLVSNRQKAITRTAAVHAIADAALERIVHVQARLRDREAVVLIAEGQIEFDGPALSEVERALQQIPLHDLETANLVALTVRMSGIVRQFRENTEQVLIESRQIDTRRFNEFLSSHRQMCDACRDTVREIAQELHRLQQRDLGWTSLF